VAWSVNTKQKCFELPSELFSKIELVETNLGQGESGLDSEFRTG